MPNPSEMERKAQWDADAISQRNEQYRRLEKSRNHCPNDDEGRHSPDEHGQCDDCRENVGSYHYLGQDAEEPKEFDLYPVEFYDGRGNLVHNDDMTIQQAFDYARKNNFALVFWDKFVSPKSQVNAFGGLIELIRDKTREASQDAALEEY